MTGGYRTAEGVFDPSRSVDRDLMLYGEAFEIDGQRIDPRRVTVRKCNYLVDIRHAIIDFDEEIRAYREEGFPIGLNDWLAHNRASTESPSG